MLESDINGRYNDELIKKMEDIYKGNKHVSTSEEITVLLQIGAVLEYNGSQSEQVKRIDDFLEENM